MSHSNIHRALVTYSSVDTGEIRVKIPSLIGVASEVSISYIGRSSSNDYWAVPKVGDQILVTSDDDNLTNVFWIQTEPYNPGTKEPTGFSNASDSTMSFDNITRTFTISPIDGVYEVFVRGVKYEITESKSITIPNTTGGYSIYFDASGELGYRFGHFDLEWEAPISYVYWSTLNGSSAIVFSDERHGTTLDWQTHEYLHRTQGAQYANGFAISNYTTNGTGSTTADMNIDIANGTFFDEDLQVDITHSANPVPNTWQQKLQGGAYIPVFYYTASGWGKTDATQYPIKLDSMLIPQYNSGTSLLTMGNNRYSNSWIVATNNLNEPVIAIMGQAQYSNITDAQNESWSNLSLTSFPIQEFRPLWKITFQAISGTAIYAAIRSVTDLRTSIKSIATSAEPTVSLPSSGLASGNYYGPPVTSAVFSQLSLVVRRTYYSLFYVPETTTFDRIALRSGNSFSNASGNGTVRLGIYNNSNNKPSTLVLDAGTVSVANFSTTYSITINQSLATGWYWLAINSQVAAPSNNSFASVNMYGYNPQRYSVGSAAPFVGWYEDSITGAFTTAGTLVDINGSSTMPLVTLRKA